MMFAVGGCVAVVIVGKRSQDYIARRVFVAKERECAVGFGFEVAEVDNVAAVFYGVEYAVGAAVRLQKSVHFQVFVNPKRVERFGVETREKHSHNDYHIQFAVFYTQRNVFVVVLKTVAVERIVNSKHLVIVADGRK